MPKTMIEVEKVSKLYRLGATGTGTLSHDLNRWWHKVRGKEDPYLLAGEKNERSRKSNTGYVWSLRDISFEVEKGDVLGIIGKNGAGKSTLLKILSKITRPTEGVIRLDGRIASLLEVGTGFHPELTGRENVFLNGAILGMTRMEIRKKFDAIVDFSGVEKFIDTPVKRYSSGMYVRLAFAVAAHLEPEILIIDEVLAVGDQEFQQKCLGKMKDVSRNEGRTVLFVSHNLAAVKQLCNRAILLEEGLQKATGSVKDILALYQEEEKETDAGKRKRLPQHSPGYFYSWKVEGTNVINEHSIQSGDNCTFVFGFRALETLKNCEVRFMIKYEELVVLHASSLSNSGSSFSVVKGDYSFRFQTEFPIRNESFEVEATFIAGGRVMDIWTSATRLTVLDNYMSFVNSGIINMPTTFNIEANIAELAQ